MTLFRHGLDAALSVFVVATWGFAAFALGSRFVSPAAGGLIGIAVLLTASGVVLIGWLQEQRLGLLARGVCPHCRSGVSFEHRHRRLEAGGWQPPETTWQCANCGFSHEDSTPCPQCER